MTPRVGDRVRIERDETRYPSKGTWPRFRGKVGTVVEVNEDRNRPHLNEYGVALGKVTERTDGRGRFRYNATSVAWFKAHEMVGAGSQRAADARSAVPAMDSLRRAA
ncbi:hypothetical protein BST36_17360 [Mycolicibacterium moriokaense]|uniref:Uncharacterized protein n=1 Tax=Mycolicibacterium moriokaense TaxID=39691 RepID=A0AAD1HF74_9MYCO|nr:hypothetical protein [Mycolicibacterium moriokaense]MCV7037356.1 hypothetical protein [Mycolicibacterium moriokaense]ORB21257.1 hypothetical protein BST36_17360 [Mycolicibacterium moriokaense]BBX04315.1 hypothetical protein MMOR_52510 [Mycolicibacterium moriokaense]